MARPFRPKPADIGRQRLRHLTVLVGSELRTARVGIGLSQEDVARRAEVSQEYVSAIERGIGDPSLDVLCRVVAACGHELGLRLFPTSRVSLRDSGQLALAEAIVSTADRSWRTRLEVEVGDGRAHDLVLDRANEIVAVEIERGLADLQAQARAAERKRAVLAERESRPVRLVIAVPATRRTRAILAEHASLLSRAFPMPSRSIARAIRLGHPIGGDGILLVKVPVRSSR